MADRDSLIYKAKLAEQAELYEVMVDSMKKVVEMNVDLTVEERNLLSVAYKNVLSKRRTSRRIITSTEQKEQSENCAEICQQLRENIEGEFKRICDEVIKLIDDHLIKDAASEESKVFYYKMQGDYHGHLAVISSGLGREGTVNAGLDAYKKASEIAESALSVTNHIRLGLALNFSTFYYETMSQVDQAIHVARKAFDDAISELDTLSGESYQDTTLIMQLLRDNLTKWTSDRQE